jgi:hypothetical protein
MRRNAIGLALLVVTEFLDLEVPAGWRDPQRVPLDDLVALKAYCLAQECELRFPILGELLGTERSSGSGGSVGCASRPAVRGARVLSASAHNEGDFSELFTEKMRHGYCLGGSVCWRLDATQNSSKDGSNRCPKGSTSSGGNMPVVDCFQCARSFFFAAKDPGSRFKCPRCGGAVQASTRALANTPAQTSTRVVPALAAMPPFAPVESAPRRQAASLPKPLPSCPSGQGPAETAAEPTRSLWIRVVAICLVLGSVGVGLVGILIWLAQ